MPPDTDLPADVSTMNAQQVGRAGEHYVAAEIHRRGGYTALFAGNMADIDMLATNRAGDKRISIQVKTKHAGTWQANGERDGKEADEDPDENFFWVFVDLGEANPAYYIVPRWWIRNDIWSVYDPYVKRYEQEHGYPRKSHHCAIPVSRIKDARDRWDRLGIFG